MANVVTDRRNESRWIAVLAWAAISLIPSICGAQYVLEDNQDPHRYDPNTVNVPLAYYSDVWRLSTGYAGYLDGTFQRQADAYTFLLGSSNGSYGGVFGLDNVQVLPVQRLFFDMTVSYFRNEEDQNNVSNAPGYPNEAPGSNNSGSNNVISSASNDLTGNFTFKYLLPIGDGTDRIIDHYRLDNGLLESGASGGQSIWDPLHSGRTFVEVIPRFEYMQIRSPLTHTNQADTNVLELSALYDNSDCPLTPAMGNRTTLCFNRDFGLFGSSGAWTNVSAEFAEYVPLGRSAIFRQQVLALDAYTSYTPSWSQDGRPGHLIRENVPPFYDGAALGGQERMRGYAEGRFHDRAAIYGCAELRLIPYWNPLGKIPALKSSDIAWIQYVAFAEIGRVADEYDWDKLSHHPKGDVGVGVRILTGDTVLRIDVAAANEGIQFWANLNQAF